MPDLHEVYEESKRQQELFDADRQHAEEKLRLTLADQQPERMLQFFRYDHLPELLKNASAPFCQLAQIVVDTYPPNPERTVVLRKLLEAKDAAVRSRLVDHW